MTATTTAAANRVVKPRMSAKKRTGILLHNALIAVLAFIWLIPIIWLVCTSFSEYDGINTSTFFPAKWSASHGPSPSSAWS